VGDREAAENEKSREDQKVPNDSESAEDQKAVDYNGERRKMAEDQEVAKDQQETENAEGWISTGKTDNHDNWSLM
jgi:hypothetical protein